MLLKRTADTLYGQGISPPVRPEELAPVGNCVAEEVTETGVANAFVPFSEPCACGMGTASVSWEPPLGRGASTAALEWASASFPGHEK